MQVMGWSDGHGAKVVWRSIQGVSHGYVVKRGIYSVINKDVGGDGRTC